MRRWSHAREVGSLGRLVVCLTLVGACGGEDAGVTSGDDAGLKPTTVTTVTAATTTAPNPTTTTTTTTPATTTTTQPEVVPFPWTFEGTLTRETTWTSDTGSSNTAVNEDPVTLTLLADGTVEGFHTRGRVNGAVFECDDPDKAGEIYARTLEPEVFPISWTHSGVELRRPSGGSLPTVAGTYDAEAVVLHGFSYTNTITPEGCFGVTFTLVEAWSEATLLRVSTPAGS